MSNSEIAPEFDFSIVTARNLGLEPRNRIATTLGIESFLLVIIDSNGLNRSDIANIAIEQYLKHHRYLNQTSLNFSNMVTDLEKSIYSKGLIKTYSKQALKS